MSFETIPAVLTELLDEKRRTTAAVNALVETLAGARRKFEAEVPAPKVDAGGATPPAPSAKTAPTVASRSDVTRDQVSKAVLLLAKSKGRTAVIDLLQAHGASKVPDLDEEHFAAVYEAATKAAA
jgi:hypothetical protein